MSDETKETKEGEDSDHLEVYGDTGITSFDAKVPTWLKWTYIILPIWGLLVWHIYWNGSVGWLDRGSWAELQQAANTTFPFKTTPMHKQE